MEQGAGRAVLKWKLGEKLYLTREPSTCKGCGVHLGMDMNSLGSL